MSQAVCPLLKVAVLIQPLPQLYDTCNVILALPGAMKAGLQPQSELLTLKEQETLFLHQERIIRSGEH
jgi:hypothetical protein